MITVIPDEIGEVVASMRNLSAKDAAKFGVPAGLESPYYFYGHPIDINRQMINRDKELSTKGKVYPAIALRLPVVIKYVGGKVHCTMNVAILDVTKLDYDAPERYTNVIKPTLYPLLELFFDRLKRHGFTWEGFQKVPPCTHIDQPHHGVEDVQGNKSYIFENKLDAVELRDLKINFNLKQC